jgi:hypothetical protein
MELKQVIKVSGLLETELTLLCRGHNSPLREYLLGSFRTLLWSRLGSSSVAFYDEAETFFCTDLL